MAKNVFILGAGASKEAGAPLMSEFMGVARGLFNPEGKAVGDDNFSLVFRALDELRIVYDKSRFDLDNLESVFAAFEMARLLGRLGNMDPALVERLPGAMVALIAATLGRRIVFTWEEWSGHLRVAPIPVYARFADLIDEMLQRPAAGGRPVAILTLNYDPCLDDALVTRDVTPDYQLEPGASPAALPLLKLHGSLNWVACPECERVAHWDLGKRIATSRIPARENINLGAFLQGQHEYSCGHKGSGDPFVVPPTYSKGYLHAQITPVWQAAARELSEAENIYVVGFSLPDTDDFFRHFYAIGSIGPARIRRFWVFDPDEAAGERFRLLLGPGVTRAYKWWGQTFSEAITLLASELGT